MTLYLSRLRLARDPSSRALSGLLDPDDENLRLDAHHRLLWSAFAGDPEARRDFLWRADGRGRFLVLSTRTPAASPFFEPPEIQTFAPALAPGDGLVFRLRVNATRDRAGATHQRRVDVVMDALHGIAPEERAARRPELTQTAASGWLAAQGARNGFEPDTVVVEDYAVRDVPSGSGRRRGRPRFGVLDLSGRLTVADPEAFLARLGAGFGRARAFGCGLMLIRRG